MTISRDHITEALEILRLLGFPPAQQNDRSALCLLALLDLRPEIEWQNTGDWLIGITPIMDWVRDHYAVDYKPNTRETFRRQTMHQFIQGGLALINPDDPTRNINSPKTVYQIEPNALDLVRAYGTDMWDEHLANYLEKQETLAAKYAKERELLRIPLIVKEGEQITFSAGAHSELIRAIVEEFGPRFVPGGQLIYAGDTGSERYFDEDALSALGVAVDTHGKMPDAVIYYPDQNWLILAEAVTSHGPVDGKRHAELQDLFEHGTAGLVYLTAFPDRKTMSEYLSEIAWETEVWCADAPTHLIHFNGVRFLGPYASKEVCE